MNIPNSTLQEMYRTRMTMTATGEQMGVHSEISTLHAEALYRTVLAYRPSIVVEIGMAYGIASLTILTALREIGSGGKLISIDPNQGREWENAGLMSVRRAGLAKHHELIELPNYLALPEIVKRETKIEFAYVDGWHTFDYVLLDFFFIDKLLSPGGVIGFNDCGYRAINKVLRFVKTHRKYEELDVGLKPDFQAKNFLVSYARRLLRLSNSDRYFRKREDWEPKWNYYARF